MFVHSPDGGSGTVVLTDENDAAPRARLADGVEVEVLAWRPRGAAGTRYRVRPAKGNDGWCHAGHLRTALERPPRVEPVAPAGAESPREPGVRRFGQRR